MNNTIISHIKSKVKDNMLLLKYISSILAVTLVLTYIFLNADPYIYYNGQIYSTYYKIKIKNNKKIKGLEDKIKEKLEDINNQMSVFNPQSHISQINNLKAEDVINISQDMKYILQSAQKVYYASEKMYDPTVGPLIELWGFGVNKEQKIPTDDEVKKKLQYVGFDKIQITDNQLKKLHTQTFINLSSIAKGFAVDKISELLQSYGYQDFLIDIGGEIRVKGNKIGNSGWNIGVSYPQADNYNNILTLNIKDFSVATSGDYRKFFTDKSGKKYAHTISPINGYPVAHNLSSVTVFAKECMLADAWATAFMSLGEEKGLEIANKQQIAAIFIVKTQNRYKIVNSDKMKEIFGE